LLENNFLRMRQN